jgi:hypothetical protein
VVVCAFVGFELLEQGTETLPGCFDGSLCGLTEQSFELGENLLDGVHVWTARRQEQKFRLCVTDGFAYCLAHLAAKIVQSDDLAG